jgi:casein kinase II subunit beta
MSAIDHQQNLLKQQMRINDILDDEEEEEEEEEDNEQLQGDYAGDEYYGNCLLLLFGTLAQPDTFCPSH